VDTSSRNRLQGALVWCLCLASAVSLINPIYPEQQWLQHAGTPVVVLLLFLTARRSYWSNFAFVCLITFLLLHVVGARYIYSEVPGGESLTWFTLGSPNIGRNHFDRLAHLAFGILVMPALVEALRRDLRIDWARLSAVLIVLAVSCVYEVFEWLLTMMAAPHDAMQYNGQQGDVWDMQKDMALAWVGALIALPFSELGLKRTSN
ncbi:MAG: DUF2238 domain-containing protein, partial [bacterium]|nr:DUF2238 domain-containing protein [bacterium]